MVLLGARGIPCTALQQGRESGHLGECPSGLRSHSPRGGEARPVPAPCLVPPLQGTALRMPPKTCALPCTAQNTTAREGVAWPGRRKATWADGWKCKLKRYESGKNQNQTNKKPPKELELRPSHSRAQALSFLQMLPDGAPRTGSESRDGSGSAEGRLCECRCPKLLSSSPGISASAGPGERESCVQVPHH